jgi:hypothetical protein
LLGRRRYRDHSLAIEQLVPVVGVYLPDEIGVTFDLDQTLRDVDV